jgi:hypothetical protein
MTDNFKYILQTIVIVFALIGIIYLGAQFDIFSKTKIVKVSDTIIIYENVGTIETKYQNVYVKSKPELKIDTLYKDKIQYIYRYYEIDTLLNNNIAVTQKDTLNKVDTNFAINLRSYLNMKYNIDSNEVEILVKQEADNINYVTKYVEKITTIENQYWYNEPVVRYGIPVVSFLGGFYLGAKMK